MPLRGRNNLTEERIFFVTTTVVRFLNIFKLPAACQILIDNIKYYQKKYNYSVLAYVIMPSHFHWIVVTDPECGTISDIMRDLKRRTAQEIMTLLKNNNKLQKIFNVEAESYKDQRRAFWMHQFDDEVIRNNKMFWCKLKYIHQNPVESGLAQKPELYQYSSARNYMFNDQSILKVDIKMGGVEIV
jgi:REP element-mobilizing transposase RayT